MLSSDAVPQRVTWRAPAPSPPAGSTLQSWKTLSAWTPCSVKPYHWTTLPAVGVGSEQWWPWPAQKADPNCVPAHLCPLKDISSDNLPAIIRHHAHEGPI